MHIYSYSEYCDIVLILSFEALAQIGSAQRCNTHFATNNFVPYIVVLFIVKLDLE